MIWRLIKIVHIVIKSYDDTTSIVGVYDNIEKAQTCFEKLLNEYNVTNTNEYTNALQDLYYSDGCIEFYVENWEVE